MKKRYYVTDVELKKDCDVEILSWTYAGVDYYAFGPFYVDDKGYLHHLFDTPTGKEVDVKIKY